MNINKIDNAYKILRKTLSNKYEEKEWNEFFMLNKILGYSSVESLKEEFKSTNVITIRNHIKLNIKSELSGEGAGLIFIKELGNFSNMCLHSLVNGFRKMF